MKNFKKLYFNRIKNSKEKISSIYSNKNGKDIALVVSIKPPWLFGSSGEQRPDDYFSNFSSMLKFQEESILTHLRELDDDYIPFLMPWYGVGITATGFGAQMEFSKKTGVDPCIKGCCINSIEDIKKLKLPDPNKDGLMSLVLETIKFMRENSEIPVSLTDSQGPLDTVALLCGYENLFLWMRDDPKAVNYLFDIVTESIINWVKVQKKATGEELDELNGTQIFWTPKGIGIRLSEDDIVSIGPQDYENFVMPYHSRIFNTFGKGILHFCGDASQHIPLFTDIENLAVINTSTIWNFECVKKIQEKMQDKIVLQISDIAPLNIEEFFNEFFDEIDINNVSLGSLVSERLVLTKNGYMEACQNEVETAKIINKFVKSKIREML